MVYTMIFVKDWKLCGLQSYRCLKEVQVMLRDCLELLGLPRFPAAHRLQEMRIAGKYGKSKASKRRYINRRFRCAWHMEQPIEVPEREERLCRRASEEIPESHNIPKADAAQGNIPASINSR
jgi:hypothetical protein